MKTPIREWCVVQALTGGGRTMRITMALSLLVAFPVLAASPLQGTQGENCIEVLAVPEVGPAARAGLADYDLICAVDGIRFGVEHHPTITKDWESAKFLVDYIDSVGQATLEVYRDGVAHQTDVDVTGSDDRFRVSIWSVFVQLGPTHGRAKRLGIQDGDVIIFIGNGGDPHLLFDPIPLSEKVHVILSRGEGDLISLREDK